MNKMRLGLRRLLPACLVSMMLPASAFALNLYSSIPEPLPESLPSLGVEAYSMPELGDHVGFDITGLNANRVVVTMNSWACQEGNWYDGDCANPDESSDGYVHPITLTIYAVDNSGDMPAVGEVLYTATEDFFVPWRPASDSACDDDNKGGYLPNCNNGFNFLITYDFGIIGLALPDEFIYGISYNTQHRGYAPIGEPGPYNSLNISLSDAATAGVDFDPDMLFWNTSVASWYTDGGAAGVGIFRADTQWTGYVPAVRFEANDPLPVPVNNPLALAFLAMLMLAGGWCFRRTA